MRSTSFMTLIKLWSAAYKLCSKLNTWKVSLRLMWLVASRIISIAPYAAVEYKMVRQLYLTIHWNKSIIKCCTVNLTVKISIEKSHILCHFMSHYSRKSVIQTSAIRVFTYLNPQNNNIHSISLHIKWKAFCFTYKYIIVSLIRIFHVPWSQHVWISDFLLYVALLWFVVQIIGCFEQE